jgi:16S rRNA (guanine966-N2)-methyltransferase
MARKKQSKQAPLSKPSQSSSVRIIAGQWRGRKLGFASDVQGLRPTPDRTRETLFNWLQGYIYEARCLDLFAGSGALGFEALSRGAAVVTFVEKHPRVAAQLVENSRLLTVKKDTARVIHVDALHFLQTVLDNDAAQPRYDLIFLDPPFHQGLLPEIVSLLEQYALLATSGMLYIEYAVEEAIELAATMKASSFVLHKQNKAGQVVSGLYQSISTKSLETPTN